jgi:hypothetical protein
VYTHGATNHFQCNFAARLRGNINAESLAWREIVRFKHPALAGKESDLRECIENPDLICASAKDKHVYLYYKKNGQDFICAVLAIDAAANSAFVVTAYRTHKAKQGDELWRK